jgi:hypothetical protein
MVIVQRNIPHGQFTERTFEQLVEERGNDDFIGYTDYDVYATFIDEQTNNTYSYIFNKIKEKLYTIDDSPDIDESEDYSSYGLSEFKNQFEILKKKIVLLYNKKIELEILFEEKKRMYKQFCENITSTIKCINDIDNDTEFKDMLLSKIDTYYDQLDLKELTEKVKKITSEFNFVKTAFNTINDFSPTTCMVCLERQVTHYNVECGHTICGVCNENCEKNKNCHYCRATKTKCLKLFF